MRMTNREYLTDLVITHLRSLFALSNLMKSLIKVAQQNKRKTPSRVFRGHGVRALWKTSTVSLRRFRD